MPSDMTSDLPLTIPAIVERAAATLRLGRGARRRRPPALLRRAGRAGRPRRQGPRRRRASSPATASRIWAPNIGEWVVAALGIHRAGARGRPHQHPVQGREAAYVLRKSEARIAAHRHRLPRHRLRRSSSTTRRRRPRARGDRRPARARPADGIASLGRLPRPRRRGRRRRSRQARADAVTGDDLVRHHLHVGHHRHAQGRDAARTAPSVRGLPRVGRRRRAARGRPLPHRQPVLPRLRAEGRHPRLRSSTAPRSCPTRCSTCRR